MLGRTDRPTHGQQEVEDDFAIPAAITDTGCERELNEDRYAVVESRSGVTWIVCDGVGGESGGELAAQLAIDAMRRNLENQSGANSENALRSAILEANRVIVLRRQNPAFARMGTTVVAAHFALPEIILGHAGDSRAYLVHGEKMSQLTIDHTLVQHLVDRGEITPEQALSHPDGHVLTRAIGSEPGLEVTMKRLYLWPHEPNQPREQLVLCSDGLYSLVSEDEILRSVAAKTPQDACVELVDLAKERGGFDNITIAIIPLEGCLRNEPPAGFEKGRVVQDLHSFDFDEIKTKSAHSSNMSLSNIAVFIGLLTVVSALLTALVMAFFISR